MVKQLTEYIEDQIWLLLYPVRFGGMDFFGPMTLIKLDNGDLLIHDSCQMDDSIKNEIN